jgi:selenocysteine lyase/cysteine desulfurase
LVHLNTGSAGLTSNRVLARTLVAWRQLETDPVAQSYYDWPDTVFTAANQVRGKAADLVGCSPDEILITRGTTDGITTLAQSVRLAKGDRILLSNQEHDGGEVGWLHRQKLDGVIVDRVQLPFQEYDADRILKAYRAAITHTTRVISVSHVLASTGLTCLLPTSPRSPALKESCVWSMAPRQSGRSLSMLLPSDAMPMPRAGTSG